MHTHLFEFIIIIFLTDYKNKAYQYRNGTFMLIN